MKKQELIQYLNNLNIVSYDNGSNIDNIHLGQLLSHCIENELGSGKSYQFLNEVLNDTLTYSGVKSIQILIEECHFEDYDELYIRIKNDYPESHILNEFSNLLYLIEKDLEDIIKKNEKRLNNHIIDIVSDLINNDEKHIVINNIEDASIWVQGKVHQILKLRNKTAKELSTFNTYKSDPRIINKQISDNLMIYQSNHY